MAPRTACTPTSCTGRRRGASWSNERDLHSLMHCAAVLHAVSWRLHSMTRHGGCGSLHSRKARRMPRATACRAAALGAKQSGAAGAHRRCFHAVFVVHSKVGLERHRRHVLFRAVERLGRFRQRAGGLFVGGALASKGIVVQCHVAYRSARVQRIDQATKKKKIALSLSLESESSTSNGAILSSRQNDGRRSRIMG